jgi:hypothetical protein
MKVGFADSFGDSLKTLIRHESWWYKTYEVVRYKIPVFFKNIYRFRKMLWNHRWYDYRFTLEALQTSLEIMEAKMHDGIEVRESRDKKIAKMQRAIQILKNINDDKYIDMAEGELGVLYMRDWQFEETGETTDNPFGENNEKLYVLVDNETPSEKKHNRKVFDRARKLEAQEWKELWKIFEGQDINGYKKFKTTKSAEEMLKTDTWNEWFDGSDMRGWWD